MASFDLSPRDVLFFRDARPMDVDKARRDDVFNVGHGANWPRPDQLFSAVIHQLIRDPEASEENWHGTVNDLRVKGPFPVFDKKLYLPMPLDWDMKLYSFDEAIGKTDAPAPLKAGFADRVLEKKSYPRWISLDDYGRYLKSEVGKGKKSDEKDEPESKDGKLYQVEPRVCTTLDPSTGASKRVAGKHASGRYEAEYLRLGEKVVMRCEIETGKAKELAGAYVRFGGQGGMVRFAPVGKSLRNQLEELPKGALSCHVRWTLLSPALFMNGWYPNWLAADGKVMLPMDKVLRQPGETRAAYRARAQFERKPFPSAKLIAACVGKPVVFSGYGSADYEKPTQLAVPAGSAYVFECDTLDEAAKLVEALNLKPLSDLGEKGFGLGVCSHVAVPEPFTTETNN